jgi:hypothetical protein
MFADLHVLASPTSTSTSAWRSQGSSVFYRHACRRWCRRISDTSAERPRPLTGEDEIDRGRRVVISAACSCSASTVFVRLGATASSLGQLMQSFAEPARWRARSSFYSACATGVLRIPLL